MQVLAVWAFFWFISSPMSTLYLVLERQRWFLVWNTVNFITRAASLWIGGVYGSPLLALSLFGFSGIVMYGYLNLYLMEKAGVPASRSLRILGVHFLAFLPILAVMLGLRWLEAPVWLQLVLPGLLVCASLAWTLKDEPRLRAALSRRLKPRS
jgi:O-antigen/teichoic acid export membrane protein